MQRLASASVRPLVSLLAALQRPVRRSPVLIQTIRSSRNVLHFGPWRGAFLTYLRLTSPARHEATRRSSVMSREVDLPASLQAIEADGYCLGPAVRPEIVRESRAYWQDKESDVYEDVHLECEAFSKIALDGEVLRVVRAYFGCEPTLIECKLFISSTKQDPALSSAFHFDHAGIRSLNVMVYLTDVDPDAAPHVLVSGSHRGKKLGDYLRERLPIEEAERRFSEEIRMITGSAGTLLFENAEIFHRRAVAKKPRVALISVYSTNRRRVLSRGRKEAGV